MNLLLDMNMPPQLCPLFRNAGHNARFWGQIGDIHAADIVILSWARSEGYTLVTKDLDFTDILATTGAHSPSVIQVRFDSRKIGPFYSTILAAMDKFHEELLAGAVVVVEETKSRIRILPIQRRAKT